MRIRGTKLTRAQCITLQKLGIDEDDIDNHLLSKISHKGGDDKRRLGKYDSKIEVWTLINKTTGELRDVNIG